jgi:4-aminobutyrate aminotransferase-like enzyme
MGALSASGLKSRKTVNEPLPAGFLKVFPPTCYRCPFGKTYGSCGITCATTIEDVIQMEDPSTVAAGWLTTQVVAYGQFSWSPLAILEE